MLLLTVLASGGDEHWSEEQEEVARAKEKEDTRTMRRIAAMVVRALMRWPRAGMSQRREVRSDCWAFDSAGLSYESERTRHDCASQCAICVR